MANCLWSEERKEYIMKLIPNKNIIFANVDRNGTAHWNKSDKNADIIIGYCKFYDAYFACNAKLHRKNTYSNFSCVSEYFPVTDKINFGCKNLPDYKPGKEYIIIIPGRLIEDFSKRFNFYYNKLNSSN